MGAPDETESHDAGIDDKAMIWETKTEDVILMVFSLLCSRYFVPLVLTATFEALTLGLLSVGECRAWFSTVTQSGL